MRKTPKLTAKQENFCRLYIKLGNASEAYRQSYDCANMLPNTIGKAASELLKNPLVSAKVAELRAKADDELIVTIRSITKEYDEARAFAKELGEASVFLRASEAKAKLHGLITDRKQEEEKPLVINYSQIFNYLNVELKPEVNPVTISEK